MCSDNICYGMIFRLLPGPKPMIRVLGFCAASAIGMFAFAGCNGFGRVVDWQSDESKADDTGFTVVEFDVSNSGNEVYWTYEGKSISASEVVPRLEDRLRELGVERMRVVVVFAKNWSLEVEPTLGPVLRWSRKRSVSFRMKWAVGHVREVTFGKNT